MANRTLTAMYDTSGAAESAREQLLALGVTSDAVRISSGSSTTTTTTGVEEDKGFWASLADLFVPDDDRSVYDEGVRRGGYLLTAQVPEGHAEQAIDILEATDAVDIDERSASWKEEGWTGSQSGYAGTSTGASTASLQEGGSVYEDRTTTSTTGSTLAGAAAGFGAGTSQSSALRSDVAGTADEQGSIKIVEEDLKVGKRAVERGGVRVRSYVVETPVEEQINLREERVTLERRPVDRPAAAGELDAFQDRTIEVTEHGEEAVVSKDARVKEEIVLGKEAEERVETVRDSVRSTKVDVEDTRATSGTTTTGVTDERTVTSTDPLRRS